MANKTKDLIPPERIEGRILLIRGNKMMLDADLAQLYDVETRVLVQAVKRNLSRFPDDFMFQLTKKEFATLTSQSVISNAGRGGRRTPPYAFTEQGIAMLSSVLNSPRAIAVNIQIIRTFVRVRELAINHDDLAKQLNALEAKTKTISLKHDAFARNTRIQLNQVFDAIRKLMTPPEPKKKRPIGFVTDDNDE